MLALIQARLNSTRFPNKILHYIKDKTILDRVYDRVKQSKKISNIIVSTSINESDDKLVDYCIKNRISFIRGDLNNVALRLSNAAKKMNADFFLRVNGDSPFIDPNLIDYAINIHNHSNQYDLISNVVDRSFPKGQSIEIINSKTLANTLGLFHKNSNKEHVTEYFYENKKNFNIFSFVNKTNYKNIQLSIDNKNDLRNLMPILENPEMLKAKWEKILEYMNNSNE